MPRSTPQDQPPGHVEITVDITRNPEDLGAMPEAIGLPYCQATVDYPGRGYAGMLGWVQLVRSTDNTSGGKLFEMDPLTLLGEVAHPFAFFGVTPTLFDAPARSDRAGLDWLAHSFLCYPTDGDPDVHTVQAITGFSWGFTISATATTVIAARPLSSADWNGQRELLHAEHPGWHFAEGLEATLLGGRPGDRRRPAGRNRCAARTSSGGATPGQPTAEPGRRSTFLAVLGLTTFTEVSGGAADDDAVVTAVATAGHAVLASGITVAISLLALVVVNVPRVRSMGFGGMLIPLISMLVVPTLLPALLSFVGPRIDWPRIRPEGRASPAWPASARAVIRLHDTLTTLRAGGVDDGILTPPADGGVTEIVVIPDRETVDDAGVTVVTALRNATGDLPGYGGVTGPGAQVIDFHRAVYDKFPVRDRHPGPDARRSTTAPAPPHPPSSTARAGPGGW